MLIWKDTVTNRHAWDTGQSRESICKISGWRMFISGGSIRTDQKEKRFFSEACIIYEETGACKNGSIRGNLAEEAEKSGDRSCKRIQESCKETLCTPDRRMTVKEQHNG